MCGRMTQVKLTANTEPLITVFNWIASRLGSILSNSAPGTLLYSGPNQPTPYNILLRIKNLLCY